MSEEPIMSKINILPKSIAELIAAGEVVERPASVVKELVENSIDAGAKSVAVEIQNGGVRYIRVTDDGCGIAPEDVPTAFVSHATSKIKDASDLNSILTLGFRGEALPSVAAVSRLSMLTRTEDSDEGVVYTVEGGENASCSPAGCPVGTTITVRDLFFNTPARMKFLKKDVTEGSCVTDVVTKASLAHPEVRFSLIRDGKKVLSTPGNGKLSDTVYSVFGKSVAEALIPCEYSANGISVVGYISKPLNNRPNRNMQFFFVNGRSVRIPAAVPALDEAYKNSIMVGKFPMCFLNVSIAAEKVDVNVHPAKTEIRFSEESKIFEVIYYAAKSALTRGDTSRPAIKLTDNSVLEAPRQKTEQLSFSAHPVNGASAAARQENPYFSFARSDDAPSGSVFAKKQIPVSIENGGNAFAASRNGQSDSLSGYRLEKDEDTNQARAGQKESSTVAAQQNENASITGASCAKGSESGKTSDSESGTTVIPGNDREKVLSRDGLAAKYNYPQTLPLRSSEADPISDGALRAFSPETGYNVPWIKKTNIDVFVDDAPVEDKGGAAEKEQADAGQANGFEAASDDFRIIGEAFKTYIIVEKDSKLLIIDKHAAHERMIFNKMTNSAESYSQVLLTPVPVTLSGKEYATVTENIGIFAEAGFTVDDFGDGTVAVRECPAELTKEDIPSLIIEIAGELLKGNTRAKPERLERIRETAACRAAIKAGDSLKPEETYAFVRQLLSDSSVRYCPHGRPVMYELSKHEIERQFGRLG